MSTTPEEPCPNYGEPWKLENTETVARVSAANWTRDPGDIACEMGDDKLVSLKHWPARARRIVQCVNACAGMADPAAELAAMREAIKEAHAALQNRVNSEGCSCEDEWSSPHIRARHSAACNATKSALAKLQLFTTPGA